MKWLFFWFVVIAAVGGAWAWFIPPADPVDYVQYKLDHHGDDTVGVTRAEADQLCPPDMVNFHAPCVAHLTHPHFAMYVDTNRFLTEVQAIPDEDCALMAQALEERRHLADDGRIFKNARGAFNCDFSRYGLRHIEIWPKAALVCSVAPAAGVAAVAMSAQDFDRCIRTVYVTRPVFNLSHTRFRIETGDHAVSDRETCIYTRLNGWHVMDHWALESCPTTNVIVS